MDKKEFFNYIQKDFAIICGEADPDLDAEQINLSWNTPDEVFIDILPPLNPLTEHAFKVMCKSLKVREKTLDYVPEKLYDQCLDDFYKERQEIYDIIKRHAFNYLLPQDVAKMAWGVYIAKKGA